MAESYSVEAMLSARDNGFTSTMNSAVKSLGSVDGGSQKATKSIASVAIGMGAVQVASKVFGVMANSMDAAISRFDTMQRFPKVMETFGYSAEESTVSVNKLSDGIQGLPTKLDDVVSTAQRMTAMTGNLDKSTDATLALNNAFLASGASTADASRGTDQYLQMLAKGEVDLQSWRTLQESMATGLQMVAKEMGYTGEAATTDLYEALKAGDVTFREFQNQLIDLGTGTGTLADMARKNSEGIATSFSNLRNAATVGLTGIITSFDELAEAATGKNIAQNLDSMKVAVKGAFNVMNSAIKATTPVVKLFASTIGFATSNADTLIPVISGLAGSYGALQAIKVINKLISTNDGIMIQAALSGQKLAVATQAQITANVAATAAKEGMTAAEIASLTASKASVASMAAQNGVVSMSAVLVGVRTGAIQKDTAATALLTTMTTANSTATKLQAAAVGLASGALSIGTVTTWAMSAALGALKTALTVLLGPVGLVVAGVGALIAGGVALFKWLNKETEASKKLNKEQSALADTTKTLTDNTNNNIKRREEELTTIDSNSKAYQKLADQVTDLSSREKLSASDKKQLKDSVEQLNSSMDGLNLKYDEETEKLSMSTEQLKARIDAQKEQETANQAQDDLLTILKEQQEVEAKLAETNALRDEWNKKLEEGSVKAKEHKEAIKGIDEQEKALTDTQKALQEEQTKTQDTLTAANEAIAAAVENGTTRQVLSYESLSEAQKSAVDSMKTKWQEYQESATNMFDALSDKQEMSVEEMQKNLEENQRVMSTWADNIATLASRGVDDGLLAKLRDMGPEGAGYVAALVSSSDAELQNLSDTYAKGGETATSAFATAFDTGKSGVNENIQAMVQESKGTLTDAIQAADFKSLGSMVPKGAQEGVESGTKDVADASGKMAKESSDAFAKEADIHSPSRVFREHGENIAKGAEEGIKSGESAVVNVVTQLAAKLPQEFDSLPGELHNSGVNAMQGFADGLNAGSGSVLSAAQSIANQVSSTINKALDIHSPSRVTKKSGQFTAKGLEVGMLDRLRNLASTAQKMARTVVDNMQIRSQQQLDLGFAGNGYSMSFDMTSASDQTELPPIYVQSVVELDGKVVNKQLAPGMAHEFQNLQNKSNGGRGMR